jgi:hypothetical protein
MKLAEMMKKYNNVVNGFVRLNGNKVEIKSILSAESFVEAAYNMSQLCFDKNNNFRAEYREIARRYIMIKYFTDIDVEGLTIEEVFISTQKGTWFKEIENAVTRLPLWGETEIAVDKNIEYKISTLKTSFDELCEALKVSVNETTNIAEISKIAERIKNLDDKTIIKTIVEE